MTAFKEFVNFTHLLLNLWLTPLKVLYSQAIMTWVHWNRRNANLQLPFDKHRDKIIPMTLKGNLLDDSGW